MSRLIAVFAVCAAFMGIMLIPFVQPVVTTSGATQTLTPAPFPTYFPYPLGLTQNFACPDEIVTGSGPTRRGIEVGVSDLDDLVQAMPEFYDPERGSREVDREVRIIYDNGVSQYIKHGPGYVCVQDDIVVTLGNGDILPYLIDYVAVHGEPDVITWAPTYDRRVAFWFEKGFAVEIVTSTTDRTDLSWGRISGAFLFPYQEVEGYEHRWPYNATQPELPVQALWVLGTGEEVPTEQNPFDFDAMIATITAEPSRTPTATPTPNATESPATATPDS